MQTVSRLVCDGINSGGEELQRALPGTIVYKGFNTIGLEHMYHSEGDLIQPGTRLTMMYAGGPGKQEVAEQVVRDVGFAPVYIGPIRYARNLEVRQVVTAGCKTLDDVQSLSLLC